ncbi:MAG: DegT/DnrJ/EryC1/StrS family aminotransferase [Deltaproteobacteria bacterium]|nr:DegT/DnrJ/EryC1/StrS family aminotransferase [Deltaproteobacteria bacterium]
MKVPLVDLSAQHREVAAEVEAGLAEVMANTSFVLGPQVAAFEEEFASFSGVGHCVGVANGTDALELVLRALGVGPGDEVILPANTFIASALAVTRAGAVPVFVDCDPVHHLIDADAVAGHITARSKALMAVDLYGQVAPFEALEPLCESRGIALVEDAAQSQGARRNGRVAGGFGAAAGTSFYPGKNLGAYGDAGAVLTDRDDLAERVRRLRNYGSEVKYEHPELGFNSRLDTLQAVVLSAKLRRLARWNEERRRAAALYDALLGDLADVKRPAVLPGNEHVWHLYVVGVPERDRVLSMLQESGIGAGVHYPLPCHLQGAYADLGYREGSFPVAEAAAREILSLPLFPGISAEQQERVVGVLKEALRAGA